MLAMRFLVSKTKETRLGDLVGISGGVLLVDLVRPYDESGLVFVESSSIRPRLTPRLTVERLELAGREFVAYEGGGEKKLKYPLG